MVSREDIITLASLGGSPSANYAGYLALAGKPCKNLIKKGADGVYNKKEQLFYDKNYRLKIAEGLKSRGIQCITIISDDYPEELKKLDVPPVALFLQGDSGLIGGKKLGIVGSRRTTANVIELCKQFSGQISRHITVVTGSADGADRAALEGAEYRAVSVIAGGHDYAYGGAGDFLKRVRANGLVVSESFYDTKPMRYHFPVRNRIIAGLCEGVLVVSAAEKSGALITANYAREYGKKVYALPYSPGITSGAGCNGLIKRGAALVTSAGDILADFGISLKESAGGRLTAEEQRVYNILKEGEGFLPAVAQKLDIPPYKLIPILSALEIKGKAVRLGGNRYSAI